MEQQGVRIWGRIRPETMAKLDKWSKELGISKSQLVNMCILAGLDSIIRAIRPTESLDAEKWADIMAAAQRKGVKFEDIEGLQTSNRDDRVETDQ